MVNDNDLANALFSITEWHKYKVDMLNLAVESKGDIELRGKDDRGGTAVTLTGRDADMFRHGLKLGLMHFEKHPVHLEFDDYVEGEDGVDE